MTTKHKQKPAIYRIITRTLTKPMVKSLIKPLYKSKDEQ